MGETCGQWKYAGKVSWAVLGYEARAKGSEEEGSGAGTRDETDLVRDFGHVELLYDGCNDTVEK
jgi:hypothetical protein